MTMILDYIKSKFRKESASQPIPILAKTWAVGGGKGGVGKSFIASNISCGLSMTGKKVVLIDADLGGANVHTLFGIKVPAHTLDDFIKKKVNAIQDIFIPVYTDAALNDLNLICGASGILELANPKYSQKKRLLEGFSSIEADYVIIDVGAGASINNLDFFNMADVGILVTCPTPTAIQNAYGFLKTAIHRRLANLFKDKPRIKNKLLAMLEGDEKVNTIGELIASFKGFDKESAKKIEKELGKCMYGVIVNIATEGEGERIARAMATAAYRHLGIKLPHLGTIGSSPEVDKSVKKMVPLMFTKGSSTIEPVKNLVKRILDRKNLIKEMQIPGEDEGKVGIKTSDPTKLHTGLNDNIEHEGKTFHIQTEDLGAEKGKIQTLVYSKGEILLTKISKYDDLSGKSTDDSIPGKVLYQHSLIIQAIKTGKLKGKSKL